MLRFAKRQPHVLMSNMGRRSPGAGVACALNPQVTMNAVPSMRIANGRNSGLFRGVGEYFAQDFDGFVAFRGGDVEGWEKADGLFPGGYDEESGFDEAAGEAH